MTPDCCFAKPAKQSMPIADFSGIERPACFLTGIQNFAEGSRVRSSRQRGFSKKDGLSQSCAGAVTCWPLVCVNEPLVMKMMTVWVVLSFFVPALLVGRLLAFWISDTSPRFVSCSEEVSSFWGLRVLLLQEGSSGSLVGSAARATVGRWADTGRSLRALGLLSRSCVCCMGGLPWAEGTSL